MITRRFFLGLTAAAAGLAMVENALPNVAWASNKNAYRVPEESEPHARTFMQWPVNKKIHNDGAFLEMLQNTIANIANHISEFEPVVMLMDKHYQSMARRELGHRVEIWDIPTDDLWCRDSGPLYVVNGDGDLAVSQLNFNGWGNKQIHQHDGKIATRVAQRLGLKVINHGAVGEAGGIETDGHGTLLAHESCWVNSNRNKGTRDDIEARLLKTYGAEKIIWAPGVKGADITDYHIDSLARFVKKGTVIIQMPEEMDSEDPWSKAAFETHQILQNAYDGNDRKLELVVLPEPAMPRVQSDDFVASYVNYYVCNGAVIMPQFGDEEADVQAARIISEQYPDRKIIALNIDALGEVGGGIHCATQQQPKV
jgi:agmatine deiminase